MISNFDFFNKAQFSLCHKIYLNFAYPIFLFEFLIFVQFNRLNKKILKHNNTYPIKNPAKTSVK